MPEFRVTYDPAHSEEACEAILSTAQPLKEKILVLREVAPQPIFTGSYGPTPETDAYEAPGPSEAKLIVLGGAIKWWWQASCLRCGHWDDAEIMRGQRCPAAGHAALHDSYVWWNSIEHRTYCAWRDAVRAALIDAGFLTYAPWMAFKGTWNEKAQAINDAVIGTSDALVVMSPPYAITEGTDEEVKYAEWLEVPVIHAHAPPRDEAQLFRPALEGLLGTLGRL